MMAKNLIVIVGSYADQSPANDIAAKTCHGVGFQMKLEVEISHVEQKCVRCDICSPRMCDFGLAFE